MEKLVNKSQSLYDRGTIFFIGLSLILVLLDYSQRPSLILIGIGCLLLMAILMHVYYIKKLNALILHLIDMTQSIIDQRQLFQEQIDGESYLAVLSSHLYLLDKRLKGIKEQLNQEKTNLKNAIENISHQIKTPLTAMILKEDILLESVEPQQKQQVEQIIYQTQYIHHYIESLLQLAQIEAHSIVYHPKNYLFDTFLDEIEQHLQPLLEYQDVKIRKKGEHCFLYCDFQWMSQALENIIKNCIEQKSHSFIDVSCEEFPTYQCIRIHDHGQGFQDEDLMHIFERFYQSHYQKKAHGVGIGLAISQSVIKDHHGSIRAFNDNGATFEILLPLKKTKSKYTVTNE